MVKNKKDVSLSELMAQSWLICIYVSNNII